MSESEWGRLGPDRRMQLACARGDERRLAEALDAGADVGHRDEIGRSAGHIAASSGHVGCLRMLRERGWDPNGRDKGRETALHGAARWGHAEAVEELLSMGADPNAADAGWKRPLMAALEMGQDEEGIVAEILILAGADPRAEDLCGRTAASQAKPPLRERMIAAAEKRNLSLSSEGRRSSRRARL